MDEELGSCSRESVVMATIMLANELDAEKLGENLNKHAWIRREKCIYGETILHYLAMECSVASVQIVLDAGVDVNLADEWGDTPLHSVCVLGRDEMVDLLLWNGAGPNVPNDLNEYPIQTVVSQGRDEILKKLLEYNARLDILSDVGEGETILALLPDDPEKAQEIAAILLDSGADPNRKSAVIDYPIFAAVEKGNAPLIRLLLKHGARTDCVNRDNRSVFEVALDLDPSVRVSIISLLEEARGSVGREGEYGSEERPREK